MLRSDRQRHIALFLIGVLPCLLFAWLTDHAWEDWYITYRAGKNLALGNGLVFEPGQILHTFTSPINVLLPALLSYLLGNQHDDAVLWIYRVISAGFLGGTVLLLHRLALQQGFDRRSLILLIALFIVDAKVMDFSINGQEAAFLVFFLALNLNALMDHDATWLGVSWAGLMWSRPDSFIYFGASGFIYALSVIVSAEASSRRQLCVNFMWLCLKAALILIVLYGPWILWTTWYYGTPVPHTVIAKGLGMHYSIPLLLFHLIRFPFDMLFGITASSSLFMPSYYQYGDWPAWMPVVANILAWIAAMAWLYPQIPSIIRATSVSVFIGLFYLSYVAAFAYPWYFPSIMLLATVSLAGLVQTLAAHLRHLKFSLPLLNGICSVVVITLLITTLMVGWQVRVQQIVIEEHHRKQVGLWLKEHAQSPQDTVFLECLGYIGFYSGLKMYDFPGMSSPEMVAVRKQVGNNWTRLITRLKPDWLVLRPDETNQINRQNPALLTDSYHRIKVFDQTETLKSYRFLPGKAYLEHDQTFIIFHREAKDF